MSPSYTEAKLLATIENVAEQNVILARRLIRLEKQVEELQGSHIRRHRFNAEEMGALRLGAEACKNLWEFAGHENPEYGMAYSTLLRIIGPEPAGEPADPAPGR